MYVHVHVHVYVIIITSDNPYHTKCSKLLTSFFFQFSTTALFKKL